MYVRTLLILLFVHFYLLIYVDTDILCNIIPYKVFGIWQLNAIHTNFVLSRTFIRSHNL